jgi:hypothetical protein
MRDLRDVKRSHGRARVIAETAAALAAHAAAPSPLSRLSIDLSASQIERLLARRERRLRRARMRRTYLIAAALGAVAFGVAHARGANAA